MADAAQPAPGWAVRDRHRAILTAGAEPDRLDGAFWLLLGERLASVIVAHDNIHDGRCRHGGGIRVGVHVTDQQPKATTPQPHSYIENGLVVYTAAYHLQRGQCCGSGCRHCPFVPRHVEGNRQVG
jgi:hypothetical protein